MCAWGWTKKKRNNGVSENRGPTSDKGNLENEKGLQKTEEELCVETKTNSITHFVNWQIDGRSLQIAKLAPKGDKRGVIEANVEKQSHRFKLELCVSGWRNSQDGYCAFYLTVTDQPDVFVARYRVQAGEITRLSSIRHDFHLGVGFPNFCQQESLEHIMVDNMVKFQVTVEVFTSHSIVMPPSRPLSIGQLLRPETVLTSLMTNMYRERLHTDVTLVIILLKTNQKKIQIFLLI
ncbi:hypothetical protein RFI_10341 [Reticulomyxa filosa]|uniref:Uncharacterized protein n=1 Tax=Reticulomyxa filosa TaxID=46433 RepID=X6NKF0_RETFI|nr:hypothetical protein RFI_10341 [Reticulomyxa filosa]|eukprot:ETO26795.1 hypothetical protein RFI_10341 [Reticulomyxa filosa]